MLLFTWAIWLVNHGLDYSASGVYKPEQDESTDITHYTQKYSADMLQMRANGDFFFFLSIQFHIDRETGSSGHLTWLRTTNDHYVNTMNDKKFNDS